MTSPVSFGDVVAAVQICKWIIDNCFTEENSANAMYKRFRSDVIYYYQHLDDLKQNLEHAIQEIESDRAQFGRQASAKDLQTYKTNIEREAKGFRQSLEDCKKVLRKYDKVNRGFNRRKVIENFKWSLSTADETDSLLDKLQRHMNKLQEINQSLTLTLNTNASRRTRRHDEAMQQLLIHHELNAYRQLPTIPHCVVEILFNSTTQQGSTAEVAFDALPIDQAIEIVDYHLGQSYRSSSNPPEEENVQGNLSLLKAHWVAETVQTRLESPGTQHNDYERLRIIMIDRFRDLGDEYTRKGISQWNETDFETLGDTYFDIWPITENDEDEESEDENKLNEKLLKVPVLVAPSKRPKTFTMYKVADKKLRIVVTSVSKNGPKDTEKDLYLLQDCFVPLYTISTLTERKFNVLFTNAAFSEPNAYQFQTESDTHLVQESCTGYKVIKSAVEVVCTISVPRLFKDKPIHVKGELQLWWPVESAQPEPPASPSTNIELLDARSAMSNRSTESRVVTAFPDIASVIYTEGNGIALNSTYPRAPLLVGFFKDKYKCHMWKYDSKSNLARLYLKK
jgi:hypothetical protein